MKKSDALAKLYDLKQTIDEGIAVLEYIIPEEFQDEDEKAMYEAIGEDGMTPHQKSVYDNALAHMREEGQAVRQQ